MAHRVQRTKEPKDRLQPFNAFPHPPGRPRACDFAHHQAEIECGGVYQQPLENVSMPPQMRSSHAAGFVQMREAAFDSFAALAQQPFASLASNPTPVLMHRLLFFMLVFPAASSPIRLRAVDAYAPLFQG